MLVSLKRSLVLAAVFAGMTGTQVYAQDTIIANVPFDFVVNGHTFHPGRYEVKMDAVVANPDVVSVRSRDGKAFAFTLAMPAGGHDPAGIQPALVFTRHENTYVLSQVWESAMNGREISKL
jgi:hypothetical protein